MNSEENFEEFLKGIHTKWQHKWDESKIFQVEPDSKEKFFLNFCYPYINAYQHIGHLYTLMKVEAFARYKRMKGYNVLFPQGWHATGSPIVNAAKRVKSREEKQISIMKSMGFSEEEITKFEDVNYWIEFFAPEFEKDYRSLGMSVDWRRKFITTSYNKYYDKFIQWQFRKLKEKNYVIRGKFPVVWDPVDECSVGDHGRIQGEGETPQEFCLFKFKLSDNRRIVTATLRPDTLMGITNLYVNPFETYCEIKLKFQNVEEIWIVGEPIIEKLKYQKYDVEFIKKISGKDLLGKYVKTLVGTEILVLPATFLDINYGTGMVHSVPSDSADDFIALENFKNDEESIKKYGLDYDLIKSIVPISIFETPEIGGQPAKYFIEKYGVKSQNERDKLEKIKKELYKLTFNQSKYNELYSKTFSKDLKGLLVKDGQEIIKNELIKRGDIHIYYELTGKVISRSLTECVIKVVDDQWFIDYNNPEWKKLAHECLDEIKLYPEKSRDQFNYVIDWLHEWACTRKEGLGTKLPWDEGWLIESLSDSTIYPAFYTISHMIQKVPIDLVNDDVFDYVFLDSKNKPDIENIDKMKESFNYYYPVDFRNSGKDLIQNHLAFYIFNHVAIFPKKNWPKGIGVNGWVTVDGQKMSKSLGNMIPVREVVKKFSSDIARITILNGGEEMDDPNWDNMFAESMFNKLKSLREFCIEYYNKDNLRNSKKSIDSWLISEINELILELDEAMDLTLFRTSVQKVFFDMQRILKHYLNRTMGDVNIDCMKYFIDVQLKILSPFTPHICEEIWHEIGNDSFISIESWPVADKSEINFVLKNSENYIQQVVSDIRKVRELSKIDSISKVNIFISLPWKYKMYSLLKTELDKNNRDFKSILSKLMSDEEIRKNGKEVTKLLPSIIKKGIDYNFSKDYELTIINESLCYIENLFNAKVEILLAEDSEIIKSKQAVPGKPAILVE